MITAAIAAASFLLQQQPTKSCPIGLALGIGNGQGEEAFMGALREQIRLGVPQLNISIKWQDLENDQPFSLKPVQDQLGLAKFIGADVHVTFTGINTSTKSMPPDLGTLPLGDAQLQRRWEEALLKVVKALPPNVKSLALGNEVDVYFNDHKDEIPAWNDMMKTSRALLRGAGFTAPIGVITTYDGAKRHPELVKQLQQPWDVYMTTYYPLDQSFTALPISEVPSHFKTIDTLAGNKPIYFTEFGCPASEVNKSSEDIQAAFVDAAFTEIKKRPNIKLASYFLQADFSDQMVDVFEYYYKIKDDRFRAYLSSLGLRRADGKPRKALSSFKKNLSAWLTEIE